MTSQDDLAAATEQIIGTQLRDGIALARSGERERARTIFRHIIQMDPEQEQAWLWLAWVADSREDSRRYLQEARAILPGSARIAEALRWAADSSGAPHERTEPRDAARRPRRARSPRRTPDEVLAGTSRAAAAAGRHVAGAGRTAVRAAGAASRRLADLRVPRPSWSAVRPYVLTVSLLAAIGVLVSVAAVGIAQERTRALSVLAEVLPTPNPHATPTVTVAQRVESLWRQADIALTVGNWEEAIGRLEEIRTVAPRDDRARQQLSVALYHAAMDRFRDNVLPEAKALLDRAIRVDASGTELQEERRLLKLYLDGLDAYWAQDWEAVVKYLGKVHKERPDYQDAHAMLGEGYYQLGRRLQAERDWFEARDAMERCLELLPDHAGAPERIAEIDLAITPPRRVEVSLSQFTATVYEDDAPIRVFTICHGRKGAPTLTGRYEVKTKLPMAYGAQWDIDMPHWLGIYDTGGSENGFHGLPYLRNGATLWTQALGTRCSFGCLVLDSADAEFLWNWADIGTVVFIRE